MSTPEKIPEPPGHHIAVIPLIDMRGYYLLRCECLWYSAEAEEDIETSKALHWIAVEITEETLYRSDGSQ